MTTTNDTPQTSAPTGEPAGDSSPPSPPQPPAAAPSPTPVIPTDYLTQVVMESEPPGGTRVLRTDHLRADIIKQATPEEEQAN